MQKGIVLQLQSEALNENVDIETLLRKAYLVARKLNLHEFETWILNEQNGYKEAIPEYRTVRGEIKALNPYRGWMPVLLEGELADALSKLPLSNPISFISEIYNGEKSVAFTINGEITESLNKMLEIQTKYCFISSKSELRKIISAVRNKVLEWSLLLEENGIIGADLQFSQDEINTAHTSQVINNFTNNFFSSAKDTNIQQGNT